MSKLLSVLVVDSGLSDNPTVGHFRYRQDKWQGGDSDRGVIDRNGFRCVGQVDRFQFAISGADGGWTSFVYEKSSLRRFGPDTASGYAGSAQFRQNPVRDFAKIAAKKLSELALVDATKRKLVTRFQILLRPCFGP